MSVADQAAAEFATHITETDKSNSHVCPSRRVELLVALRDRCTGAHLKRAFCVV